MSRTIPLLALVCLGALHRAGAHDCREVAGMLRGNCRDGTAFTLEATVTEGVDDSNTSLTVQDASGALALDCEDAMGQAMRASPGDIVRAEGRITTLFADRNRMLMRRASCTTVRVVGKAPPVQPTPVKARELLNGSVDYRLVQIEGVVADVVRDDIDPRFLFLTLTADSNAVYVAVQGGRQAERSLQALVWAKVRVTGICTPSSYSYRKQIGPVVGIRNDDC
ncbi:MAG: hypothetical protein IJG13_05600, partial [Kiritimatiellae bacterium]|nr:hypothetical protein [Kiritimatiellia bacterium]